MGSELLVEQKQKVTSSHRIALAVLQKQLQILNLREWLLVIGFAGGAAALRSGMQIIPSAEPITFFAILAGWLFGRKKGFLVGAGAGVLSNSFVLGGQGPWTFFQAAGWGVAGWLGGFLGKDSGWMKSIIPVLALTVVSTIIFDFITNLGWLMMMPMSWIFVLLGAVPFFLIHLSSNVVFALLLPKARNFVDKKAGFGDKNLIQSILSKYSRKGSQRGSK